MDKSNLYLENGNTVIEDTHFILYASMHTGTVGLNLKYQIKVGSQCKLN